jgi:hypothetical protein
MAGEYGEINSRDDFYRVLGEAQAFSSGLMRKAPQDDTYENIDTQLDAMWRWTANGRDPSEDERQGIDIALHAVRELQPTDDPAMEEYVQKLYALNNYFEDWPSDDVAANATDDDFWDREDE